MATRTHPAPAALRAVSTDPVEHHDGMLAGWDPYIVAIVSERDGQPRPAPVTMPAETRELHLMAWLREHGG